MSQQRETPRSTRSPLWKVPVAQEVREETQLHLDLLARDLEKAGQSPEVARRRALEMFGDREEVERTCRELAGRRDRRWWLRQALGDLGSDLKSAGRQIWRNSRWSAVVILGMAAGLAINVAAFGWAHEMLLGPIPAASPERVLTIWEAQPHRNQMKNMVGPANFMVWRDEATSFEHLAGFITTTVNLTGEGQPLRVKARAVTDGYFDILGLEPLLGRTLTDEDSAEGRGVVVLSHEFWRNRLGGREDVLGHLLDLDDEPYEIVGVMPASAALDLGPVLRPYSEAPDLFAVLRVSEQWRLPRGRWLLVMGLLGDGATPAGATAEMKALAERLEERFPEFNSRWTVNVVPLTEHLRAATTSPVLGMSLAVGLVLALLLVNIASLMLARMVNRAEELAIRATLGAGRGRLVRQILFEGAILTGAAAALAIVLALGLLRLSVNFLPANLALDTLPGLGLPMVLFAGALAVLSALIIGVWPAWLATGRPAAQLHGASHGGRGRLRTGLVFAEIALASILLVGAGLMLRTVSGLLEVDPGFETENTLAFSVQLSEATDSETLSFFDRLLERLEAIPGVETAGAVSHLPLASSGAATSYFPLDRPEPDAGKAPVADIRVLQGNVLETMGIRLLEGRSLDARDAPDADPGAVLIDETIAQELWPDSSPLGRELRVHWGEPEKVRRIVGVVEPVHVKGLDIAPRGAIYFPQSQEPESAMSLVLRTDGSEGDFLGSARAAVAELDPRLPIYGEQSLNQIVEESLGQHRFLARALGLFAAAALLIAAFGIYAVTSFSVLQRTREIGLRMALGASPETIARLVIGQVSRLAALALAVGLGTSALLGQWTQSLLYGVEPFDPITLLGVAAILASSAILAALRPALRAASVAPTRALRAS